MGDAEMSRINKNSLHLSGPTNILSFPGSRDMPSQLALSIDCWERECLTYQQMREIHFIQLLAHGFAHLANLEHGEEHDKLKDNCVMAALGSIN